MRRGAVPVGSVVARLGPWRRLGGRWLVILVERPEVELDDFGLDLGDLGDFEFTLYYT